MSGLGDQATEWVITLKTASAATGVPWTVPQIGLVVRSRNAIIALTYVVGAGLNSPPKPTTATLLADTIAMARGILAVLAGGAPVSAAAPPAYASPHGLLYASPNAPYDPCGMVKASTLARYAPEVALAGRVEPPVNGSQWEEGCRWGGGTAPYFVNLLLSVPPTAAEAQTQVLYDVEPAHRGGSGVVTGTRSVLNLGEQATAVFLTDKGASTEADLYVWEANVAVKIAFVDRLGGSSSSRAAMLAADIAIARDVLADLPRS